MVVFNDYSDLWDVWTDSTMTDLIGSYIDYMDAQSVLIDYQSDELPY